MPNGGPGPCRTLDNHDQLHRSNPLVSQSPRLEVSYPPVHFPLDGVGIPQRRSAGAGFDQKRGRRSPVSNSDAFDDKVGTAFERVLFDYSEMKREWGARSARLVYLVGNRKCCKMEQREKTHVLCIVQETSGTLDPFGHTASESVTSGDDFKEQITRVEVSIFRLSHRGVRKVR